MAYNKFTYKTVGEKLGVQISYDNLIFKEAKPLLARSQTLEWLKPDENYPLYTEIARREGIINIIFRELIHQTNKGVSVYSGEIFDVEPSLGLVGEADYLITLGKAYLPLEAPVIAVAEAKKDALLNGIGQCVAEMYAARLYNERKGKPIQRIFGVVTTGWLWGFMMLEGNQVTIDGREYTLSDLDEILGILVYMTQNVM
jgi:hypothetical protein